MGWTLAPGVSFCRVGEKLIFLDLNRDRYVALGNGIRSAFDRLMSGEPNDSDSMTGLIATGLIDRCDCETKLEAVSANVPTSDLSALPMERPGFQMTIAAFRHLYWARGAMQSGRLAKTVSALKYSKLHRDVSDNEQGLVDLAAAYAMARLLVPLTPKCLIDSLALFRLLVAQNMSPNLIFGVRLTPFAAHCWLQSSTVVLTGSAEDARNFTPIMLI